MICTLRTKYDPEICVSTDMIDISNYSIWCPAKLSLDGYDLHYENLLIFDFFVHHSDSKFLVKSQEVSVGRFNYNREETSHSNIFNIENISITYKAYKFKEEGFETLGNIKISSISLKHEILLEEITCKVNDTYLGPPPWKQPLCFDNEDIVIRIYRPKIKEVKEIQLEWDQFANYQCQNILDGKRGLVKRKLPSPRVLKMCMIEKDGITVYFYKMEDGKIEVINFKV